MQSHSWFQAPPWEDGTGSGPGAQALYTASGGQGETVEANPSFLVAVWAATDPDVLEQT